ncbi:MAG: hypothetical protein ABSA23_04465 [Anaerolineales bacterium]
MKRFLIAIAFLSILMFACNLTTATPVQITPALTLPAQSTPMMPTFSLPAQPTPIPPTVTLPAQPTPIKPTVTLLPQPQTNVTCNNLSFYLNKLVAFNYTCATVPQQLVGIGAHPQYTQVTLTTYQTGSSVSPQIDVFSVQSYNADFPPNGISDFQSTLQALIDGGTPGNTLPFLNPHESAQIFYAQYKVLHVPSGNGIRYLTQFAQNYAVITNNAMFYTYQGLTSDGKYVITALLPVSNPILPNSGDTYPGGETWQQFSDNFNTYIANTKSHLDAQPSAIFSPSLALLDDLVNSIQIQP